MPGGSVTLTGVTLPGVPALVVGSNGHVAWGFTNSYGDWSDLVLLHIEDAERIFRLEGEFDRAAGPAGRWIHARQGDRHAISGAISIGRCFYGLGGRGIPGCGFRLRLG